MEYKEVSAKTVDDAVLEAAIQFGTTRDNIAYEVIAQGSAGFLGIGSKKAVIKAHVRTEEEIQASKKAEKEVEKILERVNEKSEEKPVIPQPKKEPVKEIKKEVKKETVPAKDKPVKAERAEEPKKEEKPEKKPIHIDTEPVKEFLDKVFAAMDMKVRITITSSSKEHEISVELEGDDMGVLIGKRGQTLDSLQYLASLVANKSSEDYIRVKVDTENYRERRSMRRQNG